jgi:hypothetical protein
VARSNLFRLLSGSGPFADRTVAESVIYRARQASFGELFEEVPITLSEIVTLSFSADAEDFFFRACGLERHSLQAAIWQVLIGPYARLTVSRLDQVTIAALVKAYRRVYGELPG